MGDGFGGSTGQNLFPKQVHSPVTVDVEGKDRSTAPGQNLDHPGNCPVRIAGVRLPQVDPHTLADLRQSSKSSRSCHVAHDLLHKG